MNTETEAKPDLDREQLEPVYKPMCSRCRVRPIEHVPDVLCDSCRVETILEPNVAEREKYIIAAGWTRFGGLWTAPPELRLRRMAEYVCSPTTLGHAYNIQRQEDRTADKHVYSKTTENGITTTVTVGALNQTRNEIENKKEGTGPIPTSTLVSEWRAMDPTCPATSVFVRDTLSRYDRTPALVEADTSGWRWYVWWNGIAYRDNPSTLTREAAMKAADDKLRSLGVSLSENATEIEGDTVPSLTSTRLPEIIENKKEETMNDPKTETTTLKNLLNDTATRAKESILAELPEAGWRLAGRNAIDRTPGPLLKALSKKRILPALVAKQAAAFLKTEIGSGLYGLGVGTLLTLHPRVAAKPWLGKLASEMRTEGFTRIGATILDPVLDTLEEVFENILEDTGIDVREPARMRAGRDETVSSTVNGVAHDVAGAKIVS